jgi:hypothetical protein
MRPSSLFFFLAPALVAQAQSSGRGSNSANVHVSTILSVGQNVDGNHQVHSFTSTILTTITDSPAPSGNPGGGNQPSGSGASGNSSAATTTTPRNLPTASPVDGGGGPNGAPVVGKDNSGGIYGPPDNHFSSAGHLQPLAYLASFGGLAIGAFATLI